MKPPVLMKVACGCLTETNPIRAACIKIIQYPPEAADNKYFDMFITVFIVINTVVLCLPNTSVCTSDGACDWMREPTHAGIYDFNNASSGAGGRLRARAILSLRARSGDVSAAAPVRAPPPLSSPTRARRRWSGSSTSSS